MFQVWGRLRQDLWSSVRPKPNERFTFHISCFVWDNYVKCGLRKWVWFLQFFTLTQKRMEYPPTKKWQLQDFKGQMNTLGTLDSFLLVSLFIVLVSRTRVVIDYGIAFSLGVRILVDFQQSLAPSQWCSCQRNNTNSIR